MPFGSPPVRIDSSSMEQMSVHPYLQTSGPIAIAHRGGALETPENTREAFAHASALGYRYLETDTHLTKDGVVVAFHDAELDRVSSETGPINTWTWADLQKVTLADGATMVSIEELLEEFPESYFNIDVKSNEVVEPLLAVLDNQSAYERVCIGSFADARLAKVNKLRPDIACTSFGPRGIVECVLASFGAPITLRAGLALQLPPKLGVIPVLTPRLIDWAHSNDLFVHAWTIDDEAEMKRLLDLGIDGIMTDRPTLLKQVFSYRGLSL